MVSAAEATWNEVGVEEAIWIIASHRSKARHVHIMPLQEEALAILRRSRQRYPKSPWFFPCGSPHDVRRSGATALTGRWGAGLVLSRSRLSADLLPQGILRQPKCETRMQCSLSPVSDLRGRAERLKNKLFSLCQPPGRSLDWKAAAPRDGLASRVRALADRRVGRPHDVGGGRAAVIQATGRRATAIRRTMSFIWPSRP